MCRVEWRLLAGRETGTAALLRAVAEEAVGTQDPAPDERYRAGVDPSRPTQPSRWEWLSLPLSRQIPTCTPEGSPRRKRRSRLHRPAERVGAYARPRSSRT